MGNGADKNTSIKLVYITHILYSKSFKGQFKFVTHWKSWQLWLLIHLHYMKKKVTWIFETFRTFGTKIIQRVWEITVYSWLLAWKADESSVYFDRANIERIWGAYVLITPNWERKSHLACIFWLQSKNNYKDTFIRTQMRSYFCISCFQSFIWPKIQKISDSLI